MEFLDARRLTGPSLLFNAPGSILDVACSADEALRFGELWPERVRAMLAAMDWDIEPEFRVIQLSGGASFGFTAPIDTLYTASELNEWAFADCAAQLAGSECPDFAATVTALRTALAEEQNPALLALQAAAAARDVSLLWDDDEVSLGFGRHSHVWPIGELPAVDEIDWSAFADIPLALVTGTNGKTTSVRLAAHILRQAGLRTGLSSTDYISIDDDIIDRDDWSGPGGARAVLRRPEADAAILETARGGLLRRGLGVERADAALITNIARDHLGDFGSRNLAELLRIKWIVSRAVARDGKLVLNADDSLLVAQAADYPGEIVWFSLDPDNTVVAEHCRAGGAAFVLDGRNLVLRQGETTTPLLAEADVPLTLAGAARHNTANALAAAALTWSMGMSPEQICNGLRSMQLADNPGRCNFYSVDGATVIVDFAHNPQAMQALLGMAARLPAERRILCFGQAGDRTDELIEELARDAWSIGLERVNVSELADYYRGREAGEVYALIEAELRRLGATPDQIGHYDREVDALDAALAWAQPGDQVIMLALERSADLKARLAELG